jgi:hypothetical protein
VVVVCALGIAVGTGWAVVMRHLSDLARPPWVKTAAIVLMLAALTVRASVTRRLVAERVRQSSVSNPCALGVPSPDREFLRALINRFDPSSPACPP